MIRTRRTRPAPTELPRTRVRRGNRGSAIAVGLVLACLASGCTVFGARDDRVGTGRAVALEECLLSPPEGGSQVDALCGTVQVFEDRAARRGRRIDLNVAVIPSISRNPEPDALFLLAGGPGQAATEAFLPILFAFERLRQDRDVVLVDQRGTGASNPLDCEPMDEGGEAFDDDAARVWARACVEALQPSADLRLYTTSIAADDLEDVRRALGYETVDLYGASYGTRAALEYARRYPDRVRTIVLDGVVPPDLALGTTVARDAQHALDAYVDRCAANPACEATFPGLRGLLDDLLQELEEPMDVRIDDPYTGEDTIVRLDRITAAGTLRFLSYAPETAALLPLIVNAAARERDFGPLAAQVLMLGDAASESVSIGMHFSVVCAEDVPFFDAEDVAMYNADTYLADMLTGRFGQVCDVWPRADVADEFKSPVTVDVPVLVLSGEVDPVTPPEYGASVASALPDSMHVVAPGQGHGVIYRGCVPRIVRLFVESGTLAGLDTGCIDDLGAPPFFLNPSGPVPALADGDEGGA